MNNEQLNKVETMMSEKGFTTTIASFGSRSYPLCYGKGIIKSLGNVLEAYDIQTNVLIVSEPKLKTLYGDILEGAIDSQSLAVTWYLHSGLESDKNIETVLDMYQNAADAHIDKSSVVIALGGGVIQDITNYFAATFHRGIKFVQIPTTVLAQADIGIGGCAVNHSAGKSLIGQFYQPILALLDEEVLYSLPKEDLSSGLAEVINKVLCLGGLKKNEMQADFEKIHNGDYGLLMEYIKLSNKVKLGIIELDEIGAQGTRLLLDWGHTITHSLERVLDYQITHGFALGIGMMSGAYMSQKKGHLSNDDVALLNDVIKSAQLPTDLPKTVSIDDIMHSLDFDQKKMNGQTRFILMNEFGNCVMSQPIMDNDVREVVEKTRKEL